MHKSEQNCQLLEETPNLFYSFLRKMLSVGYADLNYHSNVHIVISAFTEALLKGKLFLEQSILLKLTFTEVQHQTKSEMTKLNPNGVEP